MEVFYVFGGRALTEIAYTSGSLNGAKSGIIGEIPPGEGLPRC